MKFAYSVGLRIGYYLFFIPLSDKGGPAQKLKWQPRLRDQLVKNIKKVIGKTLGWMKERKKENTFIWPRRLTIHYMVETKKQ